ncbi:MAG: VCBS repeat-containing protein, partial [Myxococcales bacterium]|nr:VCBS repeat-containing protein [Myxococcales bacterium]
FVAIADVTGDGKPDIAAVSGIVAVIANQGKGTFMPGPTLAAGDAPWALAAADLDGDKVQDLAVVNQLGGTVTVLLARGGSFAAAAATSTPEVPGFIALGQLNGLVDKKIDLAYTPNGWGAPLRWAFGRGDGTFAAGGAASPGGQSRGMLAVDANGDGQTDVLGVGNGNCGEQLHLILSNGDGSMKPHLSSGISFDCSHITSLPFDFDGDGKLDALRATSSNFGGKPHTVQIALNKGDASGTFKPGLGFGMIDPPSGSTVADFNGDQLPDLAFATQGAASSVTMIFAAGKLMYGAPKTTPLAAAPRRIVAADLDGDKVPDLAVSTAGGVSVLLNTADGKGTLAAAQVYEAGADCVQLVATDVNGDQVQDLLFRAGAGQVKVLVGKGNGTFLAARTFNAGFQIIDLVTGDINGDTKVDVALGYSGGIAVLINTSP